MRVCSLCWHSLELLSDGPLDAESPLAVATSNDESTQPEGAILTLTAVAKHGNDDAMSALSRKLTERLQEPEIPVKLKALRLCALLAHDGSPSFQVRSSSRRKERPPPETDRGGACDRACSSTTRRRRSAPSRASPSPPTRSSATSPPRPVATPR